MSGWPSSCSWPFGRLAIWPFGQPADLMSRTTGQLDDWPWMGNLAGWVGAGPVHSDS
jgi:hypothetical protein